MTTPTWPAHCPTGQAGTIELRLPRHCASCHSYQPDERCAWPAWSEHWREELAGDLMRMKWYTPERARQAVAALEHGEGQPAAVQLALL